MREQAEEAYSVEVDLLRHNKHGEVFLWLAMFVLVISIEVATGH